MSERLKTIFHARDGATAIEFAILAPILIAILFSILELSWLILKVLILDNAVDLAAKQIYIGNVPDRAAFEQLICENAPLFSNCLQQVNVEAVEIADFSDIPNSEPECRDAGEEAFTPNTAYTTCTSSAIVFLRVCVTSPLFTPGLGFGAALPRQPDGTFAIVSSAVFMNEPF